MPWLAAGVHLPRQRGIDPPVPSLYPRSGATGAGIKKVRCFGNRLRPRNLNRSTGHSPTDQLQLRCALIAPYLKLETTTSLVRVRAFK